MRKPAVDSAFPSASSLAGALTVSVFMVCLLLPSGAAAQVVRCEAVDGRITYTNERCPAGARRARTVDDSPPLQTPTDRPAASTAVGTPESNRSDGKAVPAATADTGKAGAKASAPARSTAIEATPSRLPAAADLPAAQQMEQLDQERARQRAACEQLQRRIAFARNDVDAATGGQRASYELQLRRLQQDFVAQCPMQR